MAAVHVAEVQERVDLSLDLRGGTRSLTSPVIDKELGTFYGLGVLGRRQSVEALCVGFLL